LHRAKPKGIASGNHDYLCPISIFSVLTSLFRHARICRYKRRAQQKETPSRDETKLEKIHCFNFYRSSCSSRGDCCKVRTGRSISCLVAAKTAMAMTRGDSFDASRAKKGTNTSNYFPAITSALFCMIHVVRICLHGFRQGHGCRVRLPI
jgi:hypothetical protein